MLLGICITYANSALDFIKNLLFVYRKFDVEKAEALKEQWEECERLREKAVEEACTALRKQLRDEFAWEKEKAIAEALAHARVNIKYCKSSYFYGNRISHFQNFIYVYLLLTGEVPNP